ncbi:MAG: TolC family protein [Pirellulales bacterium]|nr:TolC family protein [Pirellulales bacterium]
MTADVQSPSNTRPDHPTERIPPSDSSVLRIVDLESIAMSKNPTIAQAVRRVNALQGKCLQVGLYPNPIIGYQGEEIGDEGAAGQQGMFVGQEVVTAGKLKLNRTVVSHEIEQARRELEMQRLRVINSVRCRAYEAIVAQCTVDLNEQLVAIGEKGVNAAETLRQAKEVSQVDVLQARVEANSAKLALSNARNDYNAAWQRLAVVVGVPDMKPTPLADDLTAHVPELSWRDTVVRLLEESPELAKAQSGVERANCMLARAIAGRRPNFDVEAAVRYNNLSESTTATVGIGVPLQIFDRNQGNICRAQAELSVARREVDRIELILQDKLAIAFKRYADARDQTKQYKTQILPDAEHSLSLVQKGYQEGEFGYLELLTTQRTYFHASLAYLKSLRELWLSTVEIQGLLLTGGLDSPGA